MKKIINQNSFESGEIDPKRDLDIKLEHYYTGCKIVENVVPTPFGSARRMPGTSFVMVTTGEGLVEGKWPPEWTPPNEACLWAWYKFNEGSGLTMHNYAENGVEDMAWDNTEGNPEPKVWSVPGFGHNDTGTPNTNARISASGRLGKYFTLAAFVKPLGPGTGTGYWFAARIGQAWPNWGEFGWNNTSPYNWRVSGHLGNFDTGVEVNFNQWYFCALRSSYNNERFQFFIRESGGELTTLVDVLNNSVTSSNMTLMAAFGLNRINYRMDGGDFFYYACSMSDGFLSMTDLNSIYQALKSRYDMN